VSDGLAIAWALSTFMVVPILVTRDIGPAEAVKESACLLRETWGENLIGNAGLNLVSGVAYFALLVVGTLGVYSVALYRYATSNGAATPGFDGDLMAQAFKVKG
jgi:hypothetical protein